MSWFRNPTLALSARTISSRVLNEACRGEALFLAPHGRPCGLPLWPFFHRVCRGGLQLPTLYRFAMAPPSHLINTGRTPCFRPVKKSSLQGRVVLSGRQIQQPRRQRARPRVVTYREKSRRGIGARRGCTLGRRELPGRPLQRLRGKRLVALVAGIRIRAVAPLAPWNKCRDATACSRHKRPPAIGRLPGAA